MPDLRRVLLLLAAGLTTASGTALHAQTVVTGRVVDSLTGRPFARASVQLVPAEAPWSAGRMTLSDSLGRFQLDSVAPGTYTFGFSHPRLDSLGMDAVMRTLAVPVDAGIINTELALPSAGTLAAALCGVRADTTGALIGRVLDASTGAARAGARVAVRWGDLVMGAGTLRKSMSEIATKTGIDGRYVLCGVPTDVSVLLQVANADSALADVAPRLRDSSGAIEIAFAAGAPLLHRDLLLASASDSTAASSTVAPDAPGIGAPAIGRRTARLAGRVVAPDGAPLRGARVRISDGQSDGRYVVTDSSGAFLLTGLTSGTQTVQVIAIGFTPTRTAVDLRPGVESRVNITIRGRVYTLDPVTVYAPRSRDATAYAARAKKGGLGFFMTGDEVRARGQQLVSFALLRAPGMRAIDSKIGRPVLGGRFGCAPRFFLDGWEVAGGDLDLELSVASLGGIEVYSGGMGVPQQIVRGTIGRSPVGEIGDCPMPFIWSK